MGYYGEPPSYCKGLEKSPLGGLKNVIKDDFLFFLTANTNTKYTACLFIKVHNLAPEQEKSTMFLIRNHWLLKANKKCYILLEKSPT